MLRKLDVLFAVHFSQLIRPLSLSLVIITVPVGMVWVKMHQQTAPECQWLKVSNTNFSLMFHAPHSIFLVVSSFCDLAASRFRPKVTPILSSFKESHTATPILKKNRAVQPDLMGMGTRRCMFAKTQNRGQNEYVLLRVQYMSTILTVKSTNAHLYKLLKS